jgi:hypothetical protein
MADLVELLELLERVLAHAHEADLACVLAGLHAACRVADLALHGAVVVVEVDAVRLQALQRGVARLLRVLGVAALSARAVLAEREGPLRRGL